MSSLAPQGKMLFYVLLSLLKWVRDFLLRTEGISFVIVANIIGLDVLNRQCVLRKALNSDRQNVFGYQLSNATACKCQCGVN
ncbi:MAG: hypothetical protein NTV00_06390 [Methylococcales bacterium]|nr:hypothetical protein [Methylococcales bacterium]